MPRRRFEELPAERREQILEAAGREFAAHGFDGATLNHILAAAGISKGAAYYYFDDKADLFATVARTMIDHVLGHVNLELDRLDHDSFWPAVLDIYLQLILHTAEKPWMLGVTKAVWSLSGDAQGQKVLAPLYDWARSITRGLMERGQALGLVRTDLPVEVLVELFLAVDAALDRWITPQAPESGPEGAARMARLSVDLLRRLLAPAEV